MSTIRNLSVGLAAAVTILAPATALAKDGDKTTRGTCSNGSTAKLKLSPDNGRIETEFEVDQNRNGVRWQVTLRRNGTLAASTNATTRGPSGSFQVRRRLADGAGTDRIVAKATSPAGETCTVRGTL
ncbi:MAG: hypothetical protein JWO02_3861 [Solirubrobacterales bacterium]|nr:hypothetical protein [Solirubrobacterales bacterium]